MDVKGIHVYTQSAETVFKSFGNKDVMIRRFKAMGGRNINVELCKLTKTSLDMRVTREVPSEVPTLLKKFMNEWNHATQEEHWTGNPSKGYHGSIKITIKGVPVTITASLFLRDEGSGSVNDMTMSFHSSIPFIGNKLAEFVGKAAEVEMQREYEFVRDALNAADAQ
jgi:hypothetical protein